jgi:hypothetical protein
MDIHDEMLDAPVIAQRDHGVSLSHAREAIDAVYLNVGPTSRHTFDGDGIAAESCDETVLFGRGGGRTGRGCESDESEPFHGETVRACAEAGKALSTK